MAPGASWKTRDLHDHLKLLSSEWHLLWEISFEGIITVIEYFIVTVVELDGLSMRPRHLEVGNAQGKQGLQGPVQGGYTELS